MIPDPPPLRVAVTASNFAGSGTVHNNYVVLLNGIGKFAGIPELLDHFRQLVDPHDNVKLFLAGEEPSTLSMEQWLTASVKENVARVHRLELSYGIAPVTIIIGRHNNTSRFQSLTRNFESRRLMLKDLDALAPDILASAEQELNVDFRQQGGGKLTPKAFVQMVRKARKHNDSVHVCLHFKSRPTMFRSQYRESVSFATEWNVK